MGRISCPETSVRNYHYSLRNNPEKRSFLLIASSELYAGNIDTHHEPRYTDYLSCYAF
jgi:hypothetical protein